MPPLLSWITSLLKICKLLISLDKVLLSFGSSWKKNSLITAEEGKMDHITPCLGVTNRACEVPEVNFYAVPKFLWEQVLARTDTAIIAQTFDSTKGTTVLILAIQSPRDATTRHPFSQIAKTVEAQGILEPADGAVRTRGLATARLHRRKQVTENLICQMEEKGHWLEKLLRGKFGQLWAPIEWAILSRDVMQAEKVDKPVFHRLLHFCVIIGLHLLGTTTSDEALEVIARSHSQWKRVLGFPTQRDITTFQVLDETWQRSMHEVVIFRRVFELAGGQANAYQQLDQKYDDTSAAFGRLIGLELHESPSCELLPTQELNNALLNAPVFRDVHLNLADLTDAIMSAFNRLL